MIKLCWALGSVVGLADATSYNIIGSSPGEFIEFLQITQFFLPHYGSGFDSDSYRNVNQKMVLGSRARSALKANHITF
jgi:hypothetical protein